MRGGYEMALVETAVTIIFTVFCILGCLFKLVCYIADNLINPLRESITTLKTATESIQNLCDRIKDDIHELDKRVTICEQSTKSAHKRLDWVCTVIDRPEGLHRGGHDEDD
jgi:hypothetical protein